MIINIKYFIYSQVNPQLVQEGNKVRLFCELIEYSAATNKSQGEEEEEDIFADNSVVQDQQDQNQKILIQAHIVQDANGVDPGRYHQALRLKTPYLPR